MTAKSLRLLAGASALVFTGATQAAVYADLNLSNDAFAFNLEASRTQHAINYAAGFILTDDHGELYHGSVFTTSEFRGNTNVHGGLGVRLYHADPGSTFQSVGLGGFLNFGLPVDGLSTELEVYYGPSILTTNDFDGLTQFSLVAQYDAFENAKVYGGYRNIDFRASNGPDFDFDSGLILGFQIRF